MFCKNSKKDMLQYYITSWFKKWWFKVYLFFFASWWTYNQTYNSPLKSCFFERKLKDILFPSWSDKRLRLHEKKLPLLQLPRKTIFEFHVRNLNLIYNFDISDKNNLFLNSIWFFYNEPIKNQDTLIIKDCVTLIFLIRRKIKGKYFWSIFNKWTF